MTSPDVAAGERPPTHAAASRRSLRARLPGPRSLALRNWPVSRRLVAVIVMAVVMGLVFGGLRVASAIGTERSFAGTTQLAVLGEQVTALAQAMETERDVTAAVLAYDEVVTNATAAKAPKAVLTGLQKAEAPELAAEARAQAATNVQAARTQALAAQIGSQFPAATQQKAATVVSQIGLIPGLRAQFSGQPPSAAIQAYSEVTADLFNLNDEITSSSGDAMLADEVRTLGAISRAKDQASQQRAILYSALIEAQYSDPSALADSGGLPSLTNAAALEQADLLAFQTSATPAQETAYLTTVASPEVDTGQLLDNFISVAQDLQDVSQLDTSGSAITSATAPDLWYDAMSDTIDRMRTIEVQIAAAIVARSQLLEQGAQQSAVLAGAVTGGVLLLVLAATLLVARSLVEPLRRLQAGALEVASVRLPSRVAELSRATDPDVNLRVEPIGVDSTDEIGRVARAFDQVHQEAVRLAGNEAMLRGNVSAMFISLSRRSVPLIDRLTRMIDALEQNEDDPDRLSSLFAMDHLITRMRRNSENLLVLAGEEPVRKWIEPVPLADVARAAVSEIEQYGRVTLNVQQGIVVSGQAAADVVHLLAEVIENATMFSPADTEVYVSGQEVSSGGVLLEVRDSGIGIAPPRLNEMNWRLDNPPLVDVTISRHMGLFAVSRLAARHGVRVRLRAASPQGLSVLVWLPGSLTGRGSPRYIDQRSRQLAQESFTALLGAGSRRRRASRAQQAPLAGVTGQFAAIGEQPDAAPPAAAMAPDAGTSSWFRPKRPSGGAQGGWDAGHAGPAGGGWRTAESPGAPVPGGRAADAGWTDSGWRIAETLGPPVRGDQTVAGLPTRVPGANLFPRSPGARPVAGGQPAGGRAERLMPGRRTPAPQRSPELARSRLSGFQLGSRDAEAGAPSAGEGASR